MIMPIEHIDAIARQEKRDVLYVTFYSGTAFGKDGKTTLDREGLDWKYLPIRKQLID